MLVKLKNYTPLWICSSAIRTCWDSHDKSDTIPYEADYALDDMTDFHLDGKILECGPKDKALIDRVGNKNKHSSTLEHLYYNFNIDGISRAVLQELARHRMASLSVKSTRYTLKELLYTNIVGKYNEPLIQECNKFIVLPKRELYSSIDAQVAHHLFLCQQLIAFKKSKSSLSNDVWKYGIPEAYKTSLAWSINARSLQNFLLLRTSKAALWEIRDLAYEIFNQLPEDHKYLFEEYINKD